jgi:hypothetical protein
MLNREPNSVRGYEIYWSKEVSPFDPAVALKSGAANS